MKKRTMKIVALLLTSVMMVSMLAGCGNGATSTSEEGEAKGGSQTASADGKEVINLWSYTDEVPNMVDRYLELNPEFAEKYEVSTTIIATTEGAYQPALDQALLGGGADAPDIYAAEAAFVLKYTQGDMADFAMTYDELVGDANAKIEAAQIAPYTVEIGKRGDDVVGLGFQATGGAAIYRRSLAQAVWGTDEPTEVAAKIGPGWDQFMTAAEEMKEQGYAMVSGGGDLWQVVRNTGDAPWIVDEKLYIDPAREQYMDLQKTLYDNGYMNDTTSWGDAWFADMGGNGAKEVFTFFGPAWLISYVMADNAGDTAGDWAVAVPPEGFFWGGTWLLANKELEGSKKEGVAELIEWITLDASETGLQYHWANGTLFGEEGVKDAVGSAVVMDNSNGEVEFLGGQDMFETFIPAGEYADGTIFTQYDETINQYFSDYSTEYATGVKTKEEAIQAFKQQVADNLGIAVD
jgi:hypothetical protein